MKRLLAHVLAIALGASAGLAAAQMAGGVMDSQANSIAAIRSGTISGATINSSPIGGTTPAAGAFTTLSATGTLTGAAANFSGTVTGTGSVEANFITGGRNSTNDIVTFTGQASGSGPTWTCQNSASSAYRPCQQIASTHGFSISGGANVVNITGNGIQITTGASANQLRTAQTTAPTCSSNCGTSPAVVGTDTAGIVTMGSSGVPASGWVITFNGTWAAAPSCSVQSALGTMVVGKMPIAVATTTTTVTVTTNGTAPATSDKYSYRCIGVS